MRSRPIGTTVRLVVGRVLLVMALVAAGLKLVQIQVFEADGLAAQAAQQRTTEVLVPALRGAVTDRNGTLLAFSTEARALYAQPERITEEWRTVGKDPEARKRAIARGVADILGPKVSELDLLAKLHSNQTTVLLAEIVEPRQARAVRDRFPEVSDEYREIRQYPGGQLAANVLGVANWRADEHKVRGLVGLEYLEDDLLGGVDGLRLVDTAQGTDTVIPGSERTVRPAVPGSNLELTVDADLQFTVQQMLSAEVARTGARGGSAVVLDAETGEVRALANGRTFDPNNLADAKPEQLGNPAVSTPFEPGSVNKVVMATAAIEDGVMTPQSTLQVPGSLRVGDRTVSDAWQHGTETMTFAGVLGRSSNVGTLLTAQRIGEDRYADMLRRFGVGQRTGIGLPGESAGRVPPREDWSATTFANLPIGQGLSVTLLQLAGMYQAIANDGVRVPPRIVSAEVAPDGTRTERPTPEGIRVASPETATTVRNMLRATVQDQPGQNRGTAPEAGLDGYQISAKTGTAQQVDPACGCYSNSKYWITFAGILPAGDPRYVVALMLDAPPGGESAAPLFHEIASYIAQRYQIPLSPHPSPVIPLTLS